MTSEMRWTAVCGDMTETDVQREAAAEGIEIGEWLRRAVDEAIAQGMEDDPGLCLDDLLAQVGT